MTTHSASASDAVALHDIVQERILDERSGTRVRILDGVSLRVERGGLLHVVGPSGSGKSSLIRLINRLDEPLSGRVEVLGRPLEDWPVRLLRRRVGLAFQEPSLLGMTVHENLWLPFRLRHDPPDDVEARIEGALELAGVERELLERDATQLSVGQKQRVALARALVGEPEILLLDEPTASLDPRSAERLLDRVATIRERRGLSVVVVTHRIEEARRLGGSMAVLVSGRVAARGAVEDLLRSPPNEEARSFLEGDRRATD